MRSLLDGEVPRFPYPSVPRQLTSLMFFNREGLRCHCDSINGTFPLVAVALYGTVPSDTTVIISALSIMFRNKSKSQIRVPLFSVLFYKYSFLELNTYLNNKNDLHAFVLSVS